MSMSSVECEPCGRWFGQYAHYISHLVHSSRHHYCEPCGRDFVSEAAKQTHLDNSERHMVCQWCGTLVGKLRIHNERNHSQCAVCDEWFDTSAHLHHHYQRSHSRIYCSHCKRLFSSPNQLQSHEMSSIHMPKSFACPHGSCGLAFVYASALVAHFEAGRCPSGIDLEDVITSFRQLPNSHYFIRKQRISPQHWTISSHGRGQYDCPLCDKSFEYSNQLAQHLKSPKHLNQGRKPFVCPSDCATGTYSLSGLLLHRERRTCDRGRSLELGKLYDQLRAIVRRL